MQPRASSILCIRSLSRILFGFPLLDEIDQLLLLVDARLLVDFFDMRTGRVLRDMKIARDDRKRSAAREKRKHLFLARREPAFSGDARAFLFKGNRRFALDCRIGFGRFGFLAGHFDGRHRGDRAFG